MNTFYDFAAGAYANPASPHGAGREAEREIEAAREKLAALLHCLPEEIIFTSGGTEANNLAILGFAEANKRLGTRITAAPWLHPSITEPAAHAHNPQGSTELIIQSHVCHETGSVYGEAAAPVSAGCRPYILLDGAQGFTKSPVPAHWDMYTISAHKLPAFPSPHGVGALAVRNSTRILPIMYGGGHERGLRPGSHNVQGIAAMAEAAAEAHANMDKNRAFVRQIRDVIASLANETERTTINCLSPGEDNFSPYILNMSFLGIRGEILVHQLSERGIMVSTVAACRSRGKNVPALTLMGFAPEIADSAVRFSFSPANKLDEAHAAREIIRESVDKLRRILG